MKSYTELLKYYDEQKDKLTNNEEVDKLELMFIGYALDTVDFVKEQFNIELNFNFEDIEHIEQILEKLNDSLDEKVPQENIMNFAKLFCGYISVILQQQFDGEFIAEDEPKIKDLKNGPALKINGQYYFILSKVYRRLTAQKNDKGDDIWWFAKTIRGDVKGTNKTITIDELKNNTVEKKGLFNKLFGKK